MLEYDNCASTDPSTNSTIECTMLCGWITTSTCPIPTPNNQCASIISSPLLNSVAESIVIFGPMFQVGCFRACSTVILENFSAGVSRKGPPLAVRMIRRTSETSNAEHRTPNAEVRAGLAVSALDVGCRVLDVGGLLLWETLPSKH